MCYKIYTPVYNLNTWTGTETDSIVSPFALGSYLSCICDKSWVQVLFEETEEKPPSVLSLSLTLSSGIFSPYSGNLGLYEFWSVSSTHQDHQARLGVPILYNGLGTADSKPRHLPILIYFPSLHLFRENHCVM